GYPKSTEHPHKLPNLIVKELPGYFLPRKTAYFIELSACVKIFLNFFKLANPLSPYESAYCTVQLVIVNNYLELSFPSLSPFEKALKAVRKSGALYVDQSSRQHKSRKNFYV
ncbi:MAG: hypothetical protein KZQ72_11260, partial [Candidatus Thiodiazotropha sp. (ex Cardiolucina cf. quadrata)]|nr:hypothetical protein [Candidatus Thiodiazotropha sp. (ex Cardiolucina cf. quadrata)]